MGTRWTQADDDAMRRTADAHRYATEIRDALVEVLGVPADRISDALAGIRIVPVVVPRCRHLRCRLRRAWRRAITRTRGGAR